VPNSQGRVPARAAAIFTGVDHDRRAARNSAGSSQTRRIAEKEGQVALVAGAVR